MISTPQMVKALSLECLKPQTVLDSERNQDIFNEVDELNKAYMSCDCKSERIPILARVYDLCLMMDVI